MLRQISIVAIFTGLFISVAMQAPTDPVQPPSTHKSATFKGARSGYAAAHVIAADLPARR